MTAQSSPIENRTIRVFISSTFQDMQDERTALIRRTFPRLREMAAQRDVTLTEVDLRWGITPKESESGKVMEICLREVQNSIPFFIGIIGNRYGWVPEPKDISDIVKERFPEVPHYVERKLSATEIEMQFGVLGRTDVDMNAYFFIKDGEDTTDVDNPERLAALKKAVRENKKYPVSSFSTPEDLADQVLAAFTKLLDDLFPVGELSALEKERLGQRAILNSLSRVYIKNEANYAAIDAWMEDWEKRQLVITGESGLGKSALVANWIDEKLKLGDALPYRIIYHFVGYGGSTGSDWHVVKAMCDEIRDRYGFEADENEPRTDEKALDELFKRVAAEGDKPLLIVLDGINQIVDVNHAKRLNWLPIPPRKVKILFTTLEDDETMQVFKDRQYPVFMLKPLTRDERIGMVRKYLEKTYRKHLQDNQLERIVDDPQNENTLVLKTLLDEVANFGVFERLDEKIEEYLEPDSIGDFYQVVLKNYEADFGEDLVRHFLSLIAVSRNGLSEEELLDITGTKDKPILWAQFFCSFRQHMIVKNGLVSFAHNYIREAVEERYVNGHEDWVKTCREEIVAALENQKTPYGKKTTRSMDEVPYQLDLLGDLERLHAYLMDLSVFSYLIKNRPFSLGKYWSQLINYGYSIKEYIPIVEKTQPEKRSSILRLLSVFSRTIVIDKDLGLLFIQQALQYSNKDEERADIMSELGDSYKLLGNQNKALEYKLKVLDCRRSLYGERHPSVADSYDAVGGAYAAFGDFKKALEFLFKALEIRQSLFPENHKDVSTSYNNLGATYGDMGNHQKALEYELKALQIRQQLYGDSHPRVATAYHNIGATYAEMHNFQKGLEYVSKALDIRLNLFGENHPDVALSCNNLGVEYLYLKDYRKALEYQLKALGIWECIFGENHPRVATAYGNIAATYGKENNHSKALEYETKALSIRRQFFGDIHPDVAMSYNNIGVTYALLRDYQKALKYELKALDTIQRIPSYNPTYIIDTYSSVGIIYGHLGDMKQKIVFLHKALDIASEKHRDDYIAPLLNSIAKAYNSDNQPEKARDFFHQAAEKYRELGDEEKARDIMNNISRI